MKPNIRIMVVLAAAIVVARVVFRQGKEIYRLRAMIAELTPSPPTEGAAIPTVTNLPPADIEELRREAAEVYRLRSEITQLRQDKAASALQARIEKLTLDLKQKSDYIAMYGDFDRPAPSESPQSSPEEVARRAAALPPGKEQDRAMSVVGRQWGLRDRNATAGWLGTLPSGSARDAAIGSFVDSADGYDIKLALEWANQIEAPESRASRVENTAQRWLREDTAAARAWLEKAQLPQGMAERLLSAK